MFTGSGNGRAGRRVTPFGAREVGSRGTKRLAQGLMDAPAVKKAVQRNGVGVKKEKQKVTAVERKQHLIVGISTEGSTISADGSEFVMNLSKFPLHVPQTAFNVGVRLVDLVVPYVWPNYNNTTGETLTISFEDERAFVMSEVGHDPTDPSAVYTIPSVSAGNIGASGNNHYAFSGDIPTGADISGYDGFDKPFTENDSGLGKLITSTETITDADTDITGRTDFVTHLVWEEKGAAGQNLVNEVIFKCEFFELYRTVNLESGFQELYIRFSSNGSTFYDGVRLSTRYKFNETNVVTIVGNADSNTTLVDVLYNDESVLIQHSVTTSGTRAAGAINGHKWLETAGMHVNTGTDEGLLIGFVHVAEGTIFNMGSTSELSLGYVDDNTTGQHSFWFQHAILLNGYKSFELRPHVKVSVAGLDSRTSTTTGAVVKVPILHEDDNTLSFVTIPTLLGYMQKVLNQFIFREFYMSQFLSVDLLENTSGSSGTNYFVQFDYDLRRASSVGVLPTGYTMDQSLFRPGANSFTAALEPCPYFWYEFGGSHQKLLTIQIQTDSYNSNVASTFEFDITDMDDQVLNPVHGDDATIDLHIVLSRDDVAKFVYESLRRVLITAGLYAPPPYSNRNSQPADSCFEYIAENTATRTIGLESTIIRGTLTLNGSPLGQSTLPISSTSLVQVNDFVSGSDDGVPFTAKVTAVTASSITIDQEVTMGTGDELTIRSPEGGNENIESFAFKFKPFSEWKKADGSAATVSTFKIDTSNLTNQVSETVGETEHVFATYTANNAFPATAHDVNEANGAGLLFHVFKDIDVLTMNVTVEDGLYTIEYLNSYLERKVNDFVQSHKHGASGDTSLIRVRGDEFNQQAQIGALLSIEDPALPSNVTFTFPEQTFNAVTGISATQGNVTGATNGTYFVDNLSGSLSGQNFQVEVIVTNEANRAASIVYGGDSFAVSETITIPSASIGGGSGNDLTLTVGSVSPQSHNAVAQMLFNGTKRSMGDGVGLGTVSFTDASASRTASHTFTNVSANGTRGSGALVNATTDVNGTITSVTVTATKGNGYFVGEKITLASADIGDGGDLVLTVTATAVFDFSTNGIAVTTTGHATSFSFCEFQGEVTTPLLAKPSYDDQNSQYITIDYGRVLKEFRGIRHIIDPKDETTRIFTFDPFAGLTGVTGDRNLETNSYEITIPSGSYTPETLTEMIDYLLRQANNEIIPNLIQIRQLKPIQKIQIGCFLSSNPNNAFPHKVTFQNESASKFGKLLGWSTDGPISISAPDYRETQTTVSAYYNEFFTNQHNFETRSVFLLSNFSRNATSPNGDPLQIVTAFAPRVNRGENIIINPNQPIINDAGTYLKDNKLDEISFKLVDGVTKEPLALGTEANNAYTVVLALEYDEAKDQEEIMRPADFVGLSTGL